MKKWLFAIVLASIFVLGACGGGGSSTDNDGDNSGSNQISAAEKVYKKNCASCHGQDLTGISAPGLEDVGSKYSAEEIEDIIENGKGTMPAMKQVTEEDRTVLAEWLASKK